MVSRMATYVKKARHPIAEGPATAVSAACAAPVMGNRRVGKP